MSVPATTSMLPSHPTGRAWAHTAAACMASLGVHVLVLWGLASAFQREPPAPLAVMQVELDLGEIEARRGVPAALPPKSEAPASEHPDKPACCGSRRPSLQQAPSPVEAAKAAIDAALSAKSTAPLVIDPDFPRTPPAVETFGADGAVVLDALPAAADNSAVQRADQRAAFEWQVQDWLAHHRHYPRAAQRAGYQGTVWVRFVLDRHGGLRAYELQVSSGHGLLDRAALELLDRAAPFPAPPAAIAWDEIELVLPVEYSLTPGARG